MQLTPEDIQKQQFNIRFRGFDVDEVDGFLEKVAENFSLLNEEKQQLEKKTAGLEQQLSEFRDREKTLQNAIISTQKLADEIEEKSHREAEKRLQEAQQEIERIKEEAYAEMTYLEKQVDELKKIKTGIKKELREFLQSYLDQLDEETSRENDPTPFSRSSAASAIPQNDQKDPENSQDKYSDSTESEDDVEKEGNGLYEKIDLSDDLDLPGMDNPKKENASDSGNGDILRGYVSDWEEESKDEENQPVLDGRMFFNLEDPVDYESGPAVIIDDTSSGDQEEPGDLEESKK